MYAARTTRRNRSTPQRVERCSLPASPPLPTLRPRQRAHDVPSRTSTVSATAHPPVPVLRHRAAPSVPSLHVCSLKWPPCLPCSSNRLRESLAAACWLSRRGWNRATTFALPPSLKGVWERHITAAYNQIDIIRRRAVSPAQLSPTRARVHDPHVLLLGGAQVVDAALPPALVQLAPLPLLAGEEAKHCASRLRRHLVPAAARAGRQGGRACSGGCSARCRQRGCVDWNKSAAAFAAPPSPRYPAHLSTIQTGRPAKLSSMVLHGRAAGGADTMLAAGT